MRMQHHLWLSCVSSCIRAFCYLILMFVLAMCVREYLFICCKNVIYRPTNYNVRIKSYCLKFFMLANHQLLVVWFPKYLQFMTSLSYGGRGSVKVWWFLTMQERVLENVTSQFLFLVDSEKSIFITYIYLNQWNGICHENQRCVFLCIASESDLRNSRLAEHFYFCTFWKASDSSLVTKKFERLQAYILCGGI